MKDNTVEIQKVVLKIGKKEIELSLAEAKELQELLNDTFGKVSIVREPIYIERPWRIYPTPWYGTYWTTNVTNGTYSITCNATPNSTN
jgi:hypothetical protein